MKQPQTRPHPQKPLFHIQKQQKQLNFQGRQENILNIDSRSRPASINGHVGPNRKKNSNEAANESVLSVKVQQMAKKSQVFMGVTALQFSILIGLIALQYTSAAIKLVLLFGLIFLTLILYPALNVFTNQIQVVLKQNQAAFPILIERASSNGDNSKQESQLPTVLKINQQVCKRDNVKTKKMRYPTREPEQQKHTQQTIKKQVEQEQEQPAQHGSYLIVQQSLALKKKLLITCKALQIMMDVIIASFCLFFFKKEQKLYQETTIVLSATTYFLSIISSVFFFVYLNSIDTILRIPFVASIPQKNVQYQADCCEQNPPPNKVSIDQLIQVKTLERKPELSFQLATKSHMKHQGQFADKPQQQHPKSKSVVQKQTAIKLQIKKSVLKPSKLVRTKKTQQKSESQELMQRRKVQINCNTIQYLEYSQISPSQSVIEDVNSLFKPVIKSKFSQKKNKQMQNRMQVEAEILSSKILARQASSRSHGFISNRDRSAPKQQVQTRADYFL